MNHFMQTPKAVYHTNCKSSDDRKLIVEDAISVLHLRRNESKLLKFYAFNCCNGFRPSKRYISKETGIPVDYIIDYRNLLEKDSLIQIGSVSILIDWNHLRLFGSLRRYKSADGTPIIPKQRRNRQFEQQYQIKFMYPSEKFNYFNFPEGSKDRLKAIDLSFMLTMEPEQLSNYLSTLTDQQYDRFKKNVRFFNKIVSRKKPTPILYTTGNNIDFFNDILFLKYHHGNHKITYPFDYSLIQNDQKEWNSIMNPNDDVELQIKQFSDKPDWISSYNVPF